MHCHLANCIRGPITRDGWPRAGEFPSRAELADPEIRWDLVQRVRREIAEGTYDTAEKLEQALERLRRELE